MVALTGKVIGKMFYPLIFTTVIAGGMGLRALDVQARKEEAKRQDVTAQIIELLECDNPEYKAKRLDEERKARENMPLSEKLKRYINDIPPEVFGTTFAAGLLGTGASMFIKTNDRVGNYLSHQFTADLMRAVYNDKPEHAYDAAATLGYLLENSSLKIYDKKAKSKCIELLEQVLEDVENKKISQDENLGEKINFLFDKATTKPKDWRLMKENYQREIRDMIY